MITNIIAKVLDQQLAARDAEIAALRAALEFAVERLNVVADQADNFHQRQEEAFDRYLKNKKGGKPVPAVALPIAAREMRDIARHLQARLLRTGQAEVEG